MTENGEPTDGVNPQENDTYIRARYKNAIDYYWNASRYNKRWYKVTRALTVVLGAFVTLIASLSSSSLIDGYPLVQGIFDVATPAMAALLTIIAGFSQSFQWGSAWQDMVLTAQQLQGERDAYLVTPLEERNFKEEAAKLNGFIQSESQGFFERLFGGSGPGELRNGTESDG